MIYVESQTDALVEHEADAFIARCEALAHVKAHFPAYHYPVPQTFKHFFFLDSIESSEIDWSDFS